LEEWISLVKNMLEQVEMVDTSESLLRLSPY